MYSPRRVPGSHTTERVAAVCMLAKLSCHLQGSTHCQTTKERTVPAARVAGLGPGSGMWKVSRSALFSRLVPVDLFVCSLLCVIQVLPFFFLFYKKKRNSRNHFLFRTRPVP